MTTFVAVHVVAALMATLAAAGQTGPAVTVTAPDRATTIERSELARWERATKHQALDVLIRSAWFDGEAREQGIVPTARQVRSRLRAEGEEMPRGLTRQDLVKYTRSQIAAEAIRERVTTAAAQSVTPEQIDAYVQAHPRTDPERRTLRLVLTRTDRNARRAKRALKAGVSWRTVARRYGTSIAQSGLQPPVTRDLLPARLGRAAFEAQQGRVLGPIKTRFGHFIFKVVEIVPEQPTPLETQRAAAWEILASEAQQRALEAFDAAFTAKWRARTICAADVATHRDCG